MANKKSKLGMISAVAAGTGTAIYLAQKAKNKSENGDTSQSISPLFSKKKMDDISPKNNYRNTERGKYERNSK